ncbi:uncharacterized protein LOC134828715 [Culicoides brevitarsis]|uniref:uncharacterized protein LOC134828715 n=1 Tax=Culicoides brevitarsis TaxID=469753 RepID=UPI00307CB1A6
MEVAHISNTPFQTQVHEWQQHHPSPVAEANPIENHWIKGSFNTYGKMVTNNFLTPDGTKHTQKKQMEILQARTKEGGALQVVKSSTSQSISSRTVTSSGSTGCDNNTTSTTNQTENYVKMEVAHISNTPFQTQVHEWQQHHPSPVAEANPIENHWIKGSFNTYGKMVTNNFLTPDGTKHTQKKQMEILQARTKEGGALQVVKSSTSQSISSRTVTSSGSTGCDNNTTSTTNRPERPTSLSLSSMTNARPFSDSFNGWHGSISRGKSQSNEDLAGNANPDDSDYEINDPWNRVSRIRRSFQYPSPSSSTPRTHLRPVDFPSRSSVDVNKIRQELESICGNGPKVQKSPSEDDSAFVALDSILKGAAIEKPDTKKKQIVTSETLQNIRSSLRRLEDDSLYKDSVLNSPRNSLSMEDDATKVSYSSASPSVRSSFGDWRSKLLSKESNLSNSSLLRRKSYGFECLDDDKMESSTDSGLGGSSPTAERKRNSLLAISKSKLSPTRITLFNDSQHLISLPSNKRNTLPAGSRFDFDGRTSIHINGNTEDECSSQDGILDENGRKSTKRVEFSKCEIHFTPDSGRVNIVETDGKPPSTNNFRRRRRGSGISVSASSTTTNSSSTTTDMQFSRFKENDEIQVAPDLIMNKSGSVDLSPLTNMLNGDDDLAIRGILKNKPIKPRQYHLGENMKDIDSIWGVKLNPIYSEESNGLYRSQEAIDSDQKVLKNGDLSKINGYSTKIDLTFKDESNKWNEGGAPAVKNVLSRSYNSSFVEYKKPVTTDIEPQHDLKSISLVKNTIRLGDSPSKFEIIESEISQPETNRRSFEFERLSSIRSSGTRSAFAPVTKNVSSSQQQNKEPPANEKQLKRDLDEAFKDLMNVSATLREMGKSTELTTIKPIKQHNTFPSIRSHANNSSSHSISTISSGNWSTYSRQSLQYESLSDFGADNCLKTKPIPKPRHSIAGTSSVSPSSEKSQDAGYDTVDTLAQTKNFVKTIQQQFEALSTQKNVIPDSNSELNQSNSNKMCIEFYSPMNSLDRKERTPEKQKKRPVPMPRTIMSDSEGVVKPSRIVAKSKAFEQLAFKSGARQLKPTELVYFGILATNECVPTNSSRTKQQNSSPNSPQLSRNSFTSSSMTSSQRFTESSSRHSTSSHPPVPKDRSDVSPVNDYFFKTSFNQRPKLPTPTDDTDRHHMSDTNGGEMFAGNTSTIERINKFERTIRENLMKNLEASQRSPKVRTKSEMLGYGLKESSVDDDLGHGYDRSHDYKRDENVLAELTKAADEIMDTVKKMDEDENRRKSRSHRHKQQYMELMKQSSSSTRSSTRDGRRMLRTASREVLNSSSEDLPAAPVKVDAPRRVRRIKVATEGGIREVQSTTTRDSTRERSSRQKPSSSGGSSRRVSSKPQSSQEEKSSSAREKGKVYTHRLKKVDDISMKPSSSSRRQSSKHAKSSTIRSSKTSL